MGHYAEYKCEGCGYRVAASSSGKDIVMLGEVEKFLCPDCKEIVEVLYQHGEKPDKVVCPECGCDKIQKWNPKTGKCPKCGGKLKPTGVYMHVD